jgi:hypothetical protein
MRAFYTQYVAVLLIMLVLIIGSSRGIIPADANLGVISNKSETHKSFGSVSISKVFATGITVGISDASELEAIAEILRSHDVKATVRLFVDKSPKSLSLALERAKAVRSWFFSQNLPDEVFSIQFGTGETIARLGAVSFESSEAIDEIS